MSAIVRSALRRFATTAPAAPAKVIKSTQRQSVSTITTQSPARPALQHAAAATSPLVPKEHLKVPVPDDCQVFQLPDGRLMSYGEYGSKAADAHPFIFIHGIPDCRFDCALLPADKERAQRLNIRWIGIDRPGMGFSTMHPGRTVLGWVDDLQHLINHLQLSQYRIFGVSGGTGYTLAAAKLLPREQLRSVGVMVGVAPWEAGLSGTSLLNRAGMQVYKHWPDAFTWFHTKYMLPIVQQESPAAAEDMMRKQRKFMRKVDLSVFETEDDIKGFASIFREAFRQGAVGVTEDSKTATEHWGFDVRDVDYPGIRLWYGSEDVNTPPHMGKWMAERLPQAIYKEYPGKSHFTVWDHVEEVLNDMLSDE
jgi:pimeloyl-ACP methyl ester carboxylesterase